MREAVKNKEAPKVNDKKVVKVVIRKPRFLGITRQFPKDYTTTTKFDESAASKEKQGQLHNAIEKIFNKYNLSMYLIGIPNNNALTLLHQKFLRNRDPLLSKHINDIYRSQNINLDLLERAQAVSDVTDRENVVDKIKKFNTITINNAQNGILAKLNSEEGGVDRNEKELENAYKKISELEAKINNLTLEIQRLQREKDAVVTDLLITENEFKTVCMKFFSVVDHLRKTKVTSDNIHISEAENNNTVCAQYSKEEYMVNGDVGTEIDSFDNLGKIANNVATPIPPIDIKPVKPIGEQKMRTMYNQIKPGTKGLTAAEVNKISKAAIFKGMNFGKRVIMMGRNYNDFENNLDSSIIYFEGHNVRKNETDKNPFYVDQPRTLENAKFCNAVDAYKKGSEPAYINVFHNLGPNNWEYKGIYALIDYKYINSQGRMVYRFELKKYGA